MTEFVWGVMAGIIIGVIGGGAVVGAIYYLHYNYLITEITELRQWGIRQRREKYF